MSPEELDQIVSDISLPENFLLMSRISREGRYYLQIACWRPDTITQEMGWGYGGRGYLSEHMVKSEVVQLAFGLYKGYLEHEARESFKYRGRRVYGPHINVDALWEASTHIEVRKENT